MRLIWCPMCKQWIALESLARRGIPYTDPISEDAYYVFECPSDHHELIREYRSR